MENLNSGGGFLLFLLALTVVASGCVHQKENQVRNIPIEDATQQQTQDLQNCGLVEIDILEASSSSAVVQQVGGNNPAGELEVTWTLRNGETTTRTVSMDSSRGAVQATNSLSGSLEQVVATSTKCQGVEATYP